MKRVLVTGGTGFVGANLCRRLLEEGHEVFCLVRREHQAWRIASLRDHIQIRVADLTDMEGLAGVVSQIRPDWVFHLAAHGAYSWQTDVQEINRTNMVGTINLILASLRTGFEVFINTGSSSEYGFKDHAPAPTEAIEPNSHYAAAKASATVFARYAAARYKACIATLRLYSVYGPFEEPGRLIPRLIVNGLKGALPPLVDPTTARDFIYVRDVEDAYLQLAQHPSGMDGQVYNVGTGIQSSVADAVQVAIETFDLKVKPKWGTMPSRTWDTSVWRADNRTLVATGWRPAVPLDEGFRRTVAWFREHAELMPRYADA